MKKVFIETYGCQMNVYDTEIVKSVLAESGYELTQTETDADIVLLNTCSVRENANNKVFSRINRIQSERNGKGKAQVGILGCMATNFRKQLLENPKLPIDFIAGPDSYKRLPQLLADMDVNGNDAKNWDVTLSEFETYSDVYPTQTEGVNAWIAVMRGCDNFCTFCVVPYTRGRERSRSPQNVVDEAKRLAEQGFRQITLLGQNVNSYKFEGNDFAYLLEKVSEVEGIERIRFTSPHPKDFPRPLLKVIAENPKLCKQIHLPLQAGNDRVLEMMNRTYTQKEYLDLVDEIRELYPQMALSTDIIVGFPTETDAEFEETLNVMEAVQYDSAFIFKYSERPQTIAKRKFPDDVPEPLKTERIVKLNEIQRRHSYQKNLAHIGQIHEVLIDQEFTKKSADEFQGRNDANKIVIFPKGDFRRGQFVNVEITDATVNILRGKVVEVLNK
ncbi:MAG: tRNA (N6-isopentenyl adenosine(37)-C2)-methylthiotransferase MiaB [Calditrichaeota bacterium]|nr:tRNA (N6-isopentenyl adenosine(37)-C2)-methylthiotransferase MiaB [Calditrichota bacterium]MCB0270162.1 tRNA (N6-isopentenyl adenosine(37)-C2)-methylthiotransferase MiaB [Calditrichota bacterium]